MLLNQVCVQCISFGSRDIIKRAAKSHYSIEVKLVDPMENELRSVA